MRATAYSTYGIGGAIFAYRGPAAPLDLPRAAEQSSPREWLHISPVVVFAAVDDRFSPARLNQIAWAGARLGPHAPRGDPDTVPV
jgi:hypothetical protein